MHTPSVAVVVGLPRLDLNGDLVVERFAVPQKLDQGVDAEVVLLINLVKE